MEESEGQSLQHIRPSELYPKTNLVTEDSQLSLPFTPLCGEHVSYLGRTANGTIALSNYRLYHQVTDNIMFYNIPLGLVEQIEVRDINHLHISCKDGRLCRLIFLNGEVCLEWLRRLMKATSPMKSNSDDLFAFSLYAWASEEETTSRLGKESLTNAADNFKNEVERLQFDTSENGPWRISIANLEYRLCNTYPRQLLVPTCVRDDKLDSAAKFRSARRVPAVVWRHRGNGAVIARCSQPEVGWLGWRSSADEQLLKAIADACVSSAESARKLLIIDARSYTTAVANRARGGGCECPEYYPNCDIQFMSLANIHAIRKSFAALRAICCPTADHPNWYSMLEGTRWLQNMSGLFHAALTVASAVETDTRPVLVHCSDGWDRTPQIVSLAQLLLDPFYRTIEGFRVLVDREWLEFGHKFADRCGLTDDLNERCPVFLQWLDCVHNLIKQFPCAFQFNTSYLVKLAQHTYSNMFGTFLCNNSHERTELNVPARTFSVWSLLQTSQYINHLYCTHDQVLWPSGSIRDLDLWRELYFGGSFPVDNLSQQHVFTHQENNANAANEFMNGDDLNGNGEEQNGNLEEFNFKDNAQEDDQNLDLLDTLLETKWETTYTEVSSSGSSEEDGSVMKQEAESVKNVDEDCWKPTVKTELDSSVESSTQTVVASSELAVLPYKSCVNFTLKTRSSHSDQPVPVTLDPVDGLAPLKDDIHQRLTQMVRDHKALERELHTTRLTLLHHVCHRCHMQSPPERPDDDGSVCSTEVSWEAVDEQETIPTLWVPDHAVSHCMGCNSQFWLGRRKHHCRSCGKVFCADCSENTVALPEEQLYEPVRVCAKCFRGPSTPPSQANSCKQTPTLLSQA